VCSTTQIADFARQVVGDRIEVRSILAPGADPHTYMPTPQDAKAVLSADLALQNGLHLEGKNWMATLVRDANKPLVTCTAGINPVELERQGQKISDPHAWFSPRNAAVYVNNILSAVIKLDPDGKTRFESRAKLYLQQLRALDAWIREQVNFIPPHQRILVTSHDAFNYFCNPKLIREVAGQAGVRIGGSLYSDSMGEQGSAGDTYIGMMRENVIVIREALAP
jgi:ABC-type Zn uptake system ZnuABC Zn-binding protein ZnuA